MVKDLAEDTEIKIIIIMEMDADRTIIAVDSTNETLNMEDLEEIEDVEAGSVSQTVSPTVFGAKTHE